MISLSGIAIVVVVVVVAVVAVVEIVVSFATTVVVDVTGSCPEHL